MDEIFVRLYDTHQGHLHIYLRSLGVPPDKLDDFVQEAFVRLYTRIHRPGRSIDREKLVAYLYTTARNLAIDNHRHKTIAGRIETDVDDTFLQGFADPAPVPEEVYEEQELQEEREKAVEKLPEKIAEAVKGLLEGKPLEIIAQEIGIQIPALKYRLRRARDLLNNA